MRCRQCGAEISENAKFCGVCGKKVEKEVVQPQQEEKKNVKVEKNQNTGKKSKGGIVALLIILCICVAITGFIIGRKKETAFSDGGNSVISKIKGEKKEEEINGAWNEFSQYYKGYVYYIKQLALDENELYRQKVDGGELVGDEEEVWYDSYSEIRSFYIYNDKIYFACNCYGESEDSSEYECDIYTVNCNGDDSEILYHAQNYATMRMYGENLYCLVEPDEGNYYIEKVTTKGEATKMFDVPEEYMNMYMRWCGKYLYSPDGDEITRIDVTKQKCVKEVAVKKEVAENIVDDYMVSGNKIYYTDASQDGGEYGYRNWYEYNMDTKKEREILREDMFPYSGDSFYIENCVGDNLYVVRSDSDGAGGQKMYCLNLKDNKLTFIRSRDTEYSDEWEVCGEYIVDRWENEDGETGVTIFPMKE